MTILYYIIAQQNIIGTYNINVKMFIHIYIITITKLHYHVFSSIKNK